MKGQIIMISGAGGFDSDASAAIIGNPAQLCLEFMVFYWPILSQSTCPIYSLIYISYDFWHDF